MPKELSLFEKAKLNAEKAGDGVQNTPDLGVVFGVGAGALGAGMVAERVRQLIAGGSMTYATILNPLDVVEQIKTLSPLSAFARGNWVHVIGEDGEELCKLLLVFTVDTTTVTMTGAGIDELNVGDHVKKLLEGGVKLSNFIGNATNSVKRLATFNSILESIEGMVARQIQAENEAARQADLVADAKADAERRAKVCGKCGTGREKEAMACPQCGALYEN